MTAQIHWDSEHRTCLEFKREDGAVFYIPMAAGTFTVEQLREAEFDKTYTPIPEYPVEKAAKLYAGYAADTGATREVMDYLASLITLTPEEIKMATDKAFITADKPSAATEKPAKKVAAKKAAPVKKAVPAKKEKTVKPAKAEKPVKTEKAPKADKGESQAAMFRRLIVENEARTKKWSDDEIFDKVAAVHEVGEDKRGKYVGFYRYDCKRKGLIPE